MKGKDKTKRKRRFLGSKIFYGTLLVFLLATVAGRIWWGHHAQSRLDEIISIIKDRGEPLEWSELAPPPVADDKNAALLYERATVTNPLIGNSCTGVKDAAYYESLPSVPQELPDRETLIRLRQALDCMQASEAKKFCKEQTDDVRQILELSAESFKLCRQARGLPESNWGIDFSGCAITTYPPPLSPYRDMAEYLCLAAMDAHERGRDDEAVEYIMDILHMADSIDQMPMLTSHMVALAIDRTAATAVENIAFDLKVGSADGAATPEQVRKLTTKLLDWRPRFTGLKTAFISERATNYDTFERFRSVDNDDSWGVTGPNSFFGSRFMFGPMWTLDEARILRMFEPMVLSAGEPNQSRSRAIVDEHGDEIEKFSEEISDDENQLRDFTRILSRILMPSIGGAYRIERRNTSSRQMAGLALAIRCYEVDKGQRPEKLEELVGDYIAEVPKDVFDSDDSPIRYLPDAKSPVLYSVNIDGKDDGGQIKDNSGRIDRDEFDMVFFLNGDRPRPKD